MSKRESKFVRRSRWSCGCSADCWLPWGKACRLTDTQRLTPATEPVTAGASLEEGASGVRQEKNKGAAHKALKLNR